MRLSVTIPLVLAIFGMGCSQPERFSQPELPATRQGAARTEGDLRYTASTAILESFPVQLATTVTVENVGSRPAALEFSDGCPVLLRAYRNPDRKGPPAWDQERETVCTLAIQQITIDPNEAREFSVRTNAREILGDSLPNGHYWLAAVVRKTGWPLELEAGEADLAR